MTQSRIEAFRDMLKTMPDDAMIWYGLASEYIKLSQLPEAIEALAQVIRLNPDLTAAYQMLGTALMSEGKIDEARKVWTDGVAVANRTGAAKARQHLEGLLASTNNNGGFCS